VTELPDPQDKSCPWQDDQPAYLQHYLAGMRARSQTGHFIWHSLASAYSEAIPTLEALQALAGLAPLVEIGAGTGYWARLLTDLGTDIVASDCVPSEINSWTARSQPWMAMEVCDALDAIRLHPDRTLFSCCPPRPGYMTNALQAYQGDALALITDGPVNGERSADPLYGALEADWELAKQVELPRWPMRFNSLMIWQRQKKP